MLLNAFFTAFSPSYSHHGNSSSRNVFHPIINEEQNICCTGLSLSRAVALHSQLMLQEKEDRCSCGKFLRQKLKIAAGVFFLAVVFGCWTVMAFKTRQSCLLPRPASCADGWIGYKGKCYYFVEAEGNWTYSRSQCSALGASLAGIDTRQDLDFVLRYKGTTDPWIGLQRGPDRVWKWVNGTKFNRLFEVRGDADCAYLKETAVSASRCYTVRSWICNKPYA